MDISFVILHYNAIKETMACVDSIKANFDNKDYVIVIVDNGSPNNSGDILREHFLNNQKIEVIISKKNVGFAKGNNLGIQYSRNILKAAFVCCLNNDTILKQQDFWKCLVKEYSEHRAAVIGPKVIRADGSVQKFSSKPMSAAVYKKTLLALTKESKTEYLKMKVKATIVFRFLNTFRRKLKGIDENPYAPKNRVLLHGCCLIFTPIFFEKLSGFDERTFLYREEELLYIMVERNGLITRYAPSLNITHLEDVATNSISKNRKRKNKFKNKCLIESTRILIETLELTEATLEEIS